MSFYFEIKTEKEISYKHLVDNLSIKNVKFHLAPEDLNNPIRGAKVYIPKKSTRGVSVYKEEKGYSIGINVMASEDDFRLAVNVSKVIGEVTNGKIIAEDFDEQLNGEQLIKKYNQNWIDVMKTTGTSSFIESIGQKGHILAIGGCYMRYYIGPRIHNSLDSTTELNYYNSLIDHIQKTQFFDLSIYQIPSLITSTHKDGTNKKSIVVFYPSGNEFLSLADYVVFPVDNGRYEVNYDIIPLIADSKFTRIDEKQFIIDSLTKSDYENIIKRIEIELEKVTDEELIVKYSNFSNHQLDDEFRRIASIPDARLKVFVLQRMSNLVTEFERRNMPIPEVRAIKPKESFTEKNKNESKSKRITEVEKVIAPTSRQKAVGQHKSKVESKGDNKEETKARPRIKEVQRTSSRYTSTSTPLHVNNISKANKMRTKKMLEEAKRKTESRYIGSPKKYPKKWWQFWK